MYSKGWDTMSWQNVPQPPHWAILSEWSECTNYTAIGQPEYEAEQGVTVYGQECQMRQTRNVSCVDENGGSVGDAECFLGGVGERPLRERYCYGSCGVTLSCEELGWNEQPVCLDEDWCRRDLRDAGAPICSCVSQMYQASPGDMTVCGKASLGGTHAVGTSGSCYGRNENTHEEAAAVCAQAHRRHSNLLTPLEASLAPMGGDLPWVVTRRHRIDIAVTAVA